MNCPECGAPDQACEAHFYECLGRESLDAGYAVVHHLLVATYMLQHSSKLTKEGWLFERELLREFVVEQKPPAFIRKQNRDVVDSGRRKFKIAAKDGLPKIDRRQWAKTIMDIRLDSAGHYCADVSVWAEAALEDAEHSEIAA